MQQLTLTSFNVHRSSVTNDETVVVGQCRQIKVCLLQLHLHSQHVLEELYTYTYTYILISSLKVKVKVKVLYTV